MRLFNTPGPARNTGETSHKMIFIKARLTFGRSLAAEDNIMIRPVLEHGNISCVSTSDEYYYIDDVGIHQLVDGKWQPISFDYNIDEWMYKPDE